MLGTSGALRVTSRHDRVIGIATGACITEGIAHDTGLQPAVILLYLKTNLADQIIRSSTRDDEGRSLFTLRERYRESRGLLGRLLSALSDQVR
jgi:hypothetical protein